MYYKLSLFELFRDSIAIVFFKIKSHFEKYIYCRMNGAPYFTKTNSTKKAQAVSSSTKNIPSPFLQMPDYLREGIGKYGSEIRGSLDTSYNDALETLKKYIENPVLIFMQ